MKKIPQATICDPPEPTTIDESDLAPGMVGVVESASGFTYLVSTNMTLDELGALGFGVWASHLSVADDNDVRRAAGGTR